ncbi:MAG: TIGR03016 family PEP-CTERM system-associated outer membrane protein [Candidatus Brocadiaceae bacterium]|nr:TIGR03016 family PEP-CTERM system-associated outer membrane protein [Candidatus Brocadiaceae bacterium]
MDTVSIRKMTIRKNLGYKSRYIQIACLFLFPFLLTPISVMAGDWDLGASLLTELIMTDNMNLSEDNAQSSIIPHIIPGFTASKEERNLDLNIEYYLDYAQPLVNREYAFSDDKFTHKLNANLESELYKDVFYLDMKANADRYLIRSGDKSGGNGFAFQGDYTQAFGISVSPYLRQHYGNNADLEAIYTFSTIDATGDDLFAGNSNEIFVTLDSGNDYISTPWDIKALIVDERYKSGTDATFGWIRSQLGHVFTNQWTGNISLGYENGEFVTTGNDPKGVTWSVGGIWTPNERTSLDFSWGQRFFGDNLYFTFNHYNKRTTWTAELAHTLESSQRELAQQNPVDTGLGAPLVPTDYNENVGTISSRIFVSDRLTTRFSLDTGRSTLGISAYYIQREYQNDGETTINYGLNTNWNRALRVNTEINIGLLLDRFRDSIDFPYVNTGELYYGLTHQISPTTYAAVKVRNRIRDSENIDDSYTENSLMATLGTEW